MENEKITEENDEVLEENTSEENISEAEAEASEENVSEALEEIAEDLNLPIEVVEELANSQLM